MVDFLLYAASLEASVATRSNISENQFRSIDGRSSGGLTVDEGVQYRHSTVGNTSIWVNLLQDCIERVSKVQ